MTSTVPALRLRVANEAPLRPQRDYVLYWMIAARRAQWNFALDRAVDCARALARPLLVLEPLEVDYPWASDRLHRFVLDGMRDNARAFREAGLAYFPYVEPSPGAADGLLAALAARACLVVTDDFPCFFLPRLVASAARVLDVRLEAVDGNGLIPLAAPDRVFTTAAAFRRHVQASLIDHLRAAPRANPLADHALPPLPDVLGEIRDRWPPASPDLLDGRAGTLGRLPIDHTVPPAPMTGGSAAAARSLARFVDVALAHYGDLHDHPDADATSRLSPFLHFGHIGPHQILAAVARRERWSAATIRGRRASGAREGWWGMSPSAERFLDQLVVWRELGYNMCARRPHDYDKYSSLPDWARATLDAHRRDRRPHLYDRDVLERAATHDRVWNAAQRQLRAEGWYHNYMRMLWGKKILEWSATPEAALDAMVAIMNRWALDGRNPNSYAGYFWILGRYDRPWPERPVFGTVRAMSTERAVRKVRMASYLARYAP